MQQTRLIYLYFLTLSTHFNRYRLFCLRKQGSQNNTYNLNKKETVKNTFLKIINYPFINSVNVNLKEISRQASRTGWLGSRFYRLYSGANVIMKSQMKIQYSCTNSKI